MTANTFDYFALIGICLMGAISPGPSLFVILGVASQQGVKAGVVSAWSHAFGVALWAGTSVTAWYIFLGQTQNEMKYLVHVVSLLACFYLIYMSSQMFKQIFYSEDHPTITTSNKVDSLKDIQGHSSSSQHLVQQPSLNMAAQAGLSISLANPKLLIFFSAIYPQVLPHGYSAHSFFLAVLIPFLIDGLWYHIVTIFTDKVGILELVNKYQKFTLFMTAIILLLLALRTLYSILIMML